MKRIERASQNAGLLTLALATILLFALPAGAAIPGITGPTFSLTATDGYISTPDGNSIYTWGYADGIGAMQYPGPTLIMTEGDVVTVTLTNALAVPTSIVFPGHTVTATGGVPGVLTQDALPGGTATYSFTATDPGTYMYHSGTEQDLQIEMGLVGAIIVYPFGGGGAYGDASTDDDYDQEYLFLISEMDSRVHELVETGLTEWVDTSGIYDPLYWFLNGRSSPDTMEAESVGWLPHQPYNSLPIMHPGQKILVRYVGAGRQLHPFHPHANHVRLIARDGRLIDNELGAIVGPERFTQTIVPGQTLDGIYTWTGKDLGWDIYGTTTFNPHTCTDVGPADGFDDVTFEWCPDHGKPIPVALPELQSVAFGGMWSGSPYLGFAASLPPGEGGNNPWDGFTYPWHSHSGKELLNNDIFPGGMLTFLIIQPWP